MAATEVGCMGVQPGLDVMDRQTEAGQILATAYTKATTLEGGPSRVYWGTEVEHPDRLWAFFDWTSIEQHQRFAKKHGPEVVQDLHKILARRPFGFSKHVDLVPSPPTLVLQDAPVVEIMLAFFAGDASPAVREAATSRFARFKAQGLDQCGDVVAVSWGWGVETDFPDREPETQRGCLLTALIGWPTIEAHMAFRNTDAYKNAVGLLTGMEGLVSMAMFHVRFETIARA